MNITKLLYRMARLSADVAVVSSGNPKRITRRAKNRLVGKALARAGVWKWLWK